MVAHVKPHALEQKHKRLFQVQRTNLKQSPLEYHKLADTADSLDYAEPSAALAFLLPLPLAPTAGSSNALLSPPDSGCHNGEPAPPRCGRSQLLMLPSPWYWFHESMPTHGCTL